AAGPYSYLLESVEGGEKWGRYSIIGLPARRRLTVAGRTFTETVDGTVVERVECDDPLERIRDYLARVKLPPVEISRFAGGLVGYFGYDTVRYVEPRLATSTPPDPLGTPDILLMVSDEFVVFDNLKGEMQLVCYVDPAEPGAVERAEQRLDALIAELARPLPARQPPPPARTVPGEQDFTSEFGHEAFLAAVERI